MLDQFRVEDVLLASRCDAILLVAHLLEHLSLLSHQLDPRVALVPRHLDLTVVLLILVDLIFTQTSLGAARLIHIVVLDLRPTLENGIEALSVLVIRLLVLRLEPLEEIMRLVASFLNGANDAIFFCDQRVLKLVLHHLEMLALPLLSLAQT